MGDSMGDNGNLYTFTGFYKDHVYNLCKYERPEDDVKLLIRGIIFSPDNKFIPDIPEICQMYGFQVDWSKPNKLSDMFKNGVKLLVLKGLPMFPSVIVEAFHRIGLLVKRVPYGFLVYTTKW